MIRNELDGLKKKKVIVFSASRMMMFFETSIKFLKQFEMQ